MPGARGNTTVRGEGAHIANLNQVLRALRSLPKDLQAELRDAAGNISEALATLSQRAASTPLEVAVGRSIRARRDRIPKVVVGGARPVIGSRGAPPGAAMYGALFGGRGRPTTQQFRPHLGRTGYLLYPQLRTYGRAMGELWLDALDEVLRKAEQRAG